MQDKFNRFMYGRYGLDELSKILIIGGAVLSIISSLLAGIIGFFPGLFRFVGIFAVIYGVFRIFSRSTTQRSYELAAWLKFKDGQIRKIDAAKSRRAQRKDFRFFKCPGCKKWLRVPRGKGKIHINCRCGYVMYRKT